MKPSRTSHALARIVQKKPLLPRDHWRVSPKGCGSDFFTTPKSPGELAALYASLLEGFDKRDRRILLLRTFRTFSARTLQELGDYFGVSRERIRQVESTCITVIKRRLKAARFRPLVDASARLAETIGLAVPI